MEPEPVNRIVNVTQKTREVAEEVKKTFELLKNKNHNITRAQYDSMFKKREQNLATTNRLISELQPTVVKLRPLADLANIDIRPSDDALRILPDIKNAVAKYNDYNECLDTLLEFKALLEKYLRKFNRKFSKSKHNRLKTTIMRIHNQHITDTIRNDPEMLEFITELNADNRNKELQERIRKSRGDSSSDGSSSGGYYTKKNRGYK